MSFLDSRTRSPRQGIGKPARRKEDARLVAGRGRYSDDFSLPGQVQAQFVRSPHAHARIRRIDVAEALAVPGVIAVLTGQDAAADGLAPIPHRPVPTNPNEFPLGGREGSSIFIAPHPVLAADTARFVGEPVAMVIAETAAAAVDGAERVVVDYAPLPSVTATRDAAEAGAPVLWEEAGSNVCVDSIAGDAGAADAAFARAAHVVRLDTWVPRVTGVPMEPRAALGVYDGATGRYTLFAGSGGVVRHKNDLADILGVPEAAVRVVAQDVGGNFGTRNSFYPEFALVVWAAKRLRRPVKWTCTRREAFLTDYQGRDLVSAMELALDADGGFLALRGVNTSNVGAHAVTFVPLNKGRELSTSVYRMPAAAVRGRAVLSNTSPLGAYRSAGRPQVMYVMERLIDLAARRHGFDRLELRRRNLVPPGAMPYTNPFGIVYDSGEYAVAQDRAVALSDWAGFEARRQEARRRGRCRGIGIANYIEIATGAPRERAQITVRPEGVIDVVIGTLSAGQGHETSFAQLIVEWLGVEPDQVRLVTGDTDLVPVGGGSHSGRSMRLGAVVMAKASDQIVDRGRRIAAWLLEAAAADIEFSERRFTVKGTDRSVGLFAIAAAALRDDAPEAVRGPLEAACDETVSTPSFPYGCAVCEVEVDPDTGVVEIVRYTSVDDVGRAINPMIVHGQTHGGIAQGVGQALWELCDYDAGTGQMRSATFMDYTMPRADMLPAFTTEISEVPSTSNPLGLRGGGEGGTTPAPAAVVNAIVDALAHLGVEHMEMPATPARVWETIRAAAKGSVKHQRPGPVRERIASCGYGPHEPLVVAINDRIHTQGCTRTGAPVTADTVTYLASLSKQFTAACVAILVADGRLDVETPAAEFVPRLPPAIRVRHLLHHTAGLPDDVVVTGDRTSDGILAALPTFDATPGIRYAYSNVGYVCLARIVETVCGAPIGDFARTAVFDPLGMHDTRFWTGPQSWPADAAPLAQAHPAPLSVGDGGAWGTAADLMRWGAGLDVDALGISDLLQTPGWLDDGTAVDYAWGMGVRSVRGHVTYRHGGGWPGTRSMLVRVPAEDLTIVVLALADDTERRVALTDALLSLDDR